MTDMGSARLAFGRNGYGPSGIKLLGKLGMLRAFASRLFHAPRVRALPLGQSFGFSLACLVCHWYQLLYLTQYLRQLRRAELSGSIVNAAQTSHLTKNPRN